MTTKVFVIIPQWENQQTINLKKWHHCSLLEMLMVLTELCLNILPLLHLAHKSTIEEKKHFV